MNNLVEIDIDAEWNIPTKKVVLPKKPKKFFSDGYWMWPTVLILIAFNVYLKVGA